MPSSFVALGSFAGRKKFLILFRCGAAEINAFVVDDRCSREPLAKVPDSVACHFGADEPQPVEPEKALHGGKPGIAHICSLEVEDNERPTGTDRQHRERVEALNTSQIKP